MLWQEDLPQEEIKPVQSVIDMVFAMHCCCLPVDHANALSQAIQKALPWFAQESLAGLHLIHGAESGNGWYRPDDQGDLLYLSRRTKFTLRLPQHRISAAQALNGMTLDIAGYTLKVGRGSEKPLQPMPVLFARHVLAQSEQDEAEFLNEVVEQLQTMNVVCRKALCGKSHRLKGVKGALFTRSLMLADLSKDDSLTLQQYGLGEGRKMGCGLFVPHKDIKPVKNMEK